MLRRTARAATQFYDRALRPAGLRLTQYSLLANTARSGGCSITELARLLAMDRTTLSRNLVPLQKAGWLEVGPGPDRRSRCVAITKEGRRVFERALPVWREAEIAFREAVGDDDCTDLRRLLRVAESSTARFSEEEDSEG